MRKLTEKTAFAKVKNILPATLIHAIDCLVSPERIIDDFGNIRSVKRNGSLHMELAGGLTSKIGEIFTDRIITENEWKAAEDFLLDMMALEAEHLKSSSMKVLRFVNTAT